MAEKELLLLDSQKPIITAESNKWCNVDKNAVGLFIKGIETSKGTANESKQKERFRAIISGVPSPWARVLLTRKAVLEDSSKTSETVLDECYKLLKSEWRGLVAAYALYPDSFEFSAPIPLTGKSISENRGQMSVRQIYGQMLFDETPLWVHKNEKVESKDNPPCIQILYYKHNDDGGGFKLIPVAATSPYTFLFSSVNYNLLGAQREIPWIDNDGKFTDPSQSNKVKVDDLQRLYSFLHMVGQNIKPSNSEANDSNRYYLDWLIKICNIEDHTNKYRISDGEVDDYISAWAGTLNDWKGELETKIISLGKTPNDSIPLVFNTKPEGPLALLLNSDHKFYFSDGALSLKNQSSYEILSSNIFVASDFIAVWDNNVENGKDYSKSAAYYVITSDNKYALPLPFTKDALHVFENNIDSIVNGGENSYVRLYANVTPSGDSVEVELKACLDKEGSEIPICKKTYRMSPISETDGKVFVWPNFCSPDWNKYFYYSEFPSNVTGVKMLPCFDNLDFSTASEEETKNHFLVRYPLDRVAASSHKYEIIQNTSPLKLIAIRLNKNGMEIDGGTLLLKRSQDAKANTLRTKSTLANLKEAIVGIDFGSTNTCAYYKMVDGQDSKPIPFSNRRLALVGFDSSHGALAGKDELLFISNEGTAFPNGQVKSWLHLHDPQYLTSDGDIEKISNLGVEIIGGVPVNESNLAVKSMNEQTIQTNAGELRYNMKWYSEKESEARKTAYMKMLWIHICADMVDSANPCYPKKLNWSFPSSMTKSDRTALKQIYESAVEYPFSVPSIRFKPVLEDFTEAEAVSAYSIYKGTEVNSSTLSLGIDVGGSTSDILIVGSKDSIDTLLTQSSVRMAGGFFFNAINSSAKFRRSLFNFHESHQINLSTKNIEDVVSSDPEIYSRAPYYLNNVFDQMYTDRDFNYFYNFMRREVKPVFAYPAYVTGVLMFYSGMLVRNAVTKNHIDGLQTIEMRYYGKGGRLFEWLLDVYTDDGERYYKKCFAAGYGSKDINLSIIPQQKSENKSEVAIGLVSNMFSSVARGEKDEEGQRIIECYDVVGEKGIRCTKTNVIMEDLDIIPDELFYGGVNMEMPTKFENFSNFIDIFTHFLTEDSGGILKDVSELEKGKTNLRVRAFIQKDPEFHKCIEKLQNGTKNPTLYRMPVFIAAALCYLNEVLLPEVSNQLR